MKNDPKLLRQGLLLEYITLGWNVIGTAVVIAAAIATRSVAFAGFGLDSLIEIVASSVVVLHLKEMHGAREQQALRFISVAFFLLSAYIFVQSAYTFLWQVHPSTSAFGIAWLVLTLPVMLALAAGKHRVGVQLNNQVLKTEARVTFVDACLAGSVLIGVTLNALIGWWWADPLAGLVIVVYGFVEGRHAWVESRAAV